MKLNEDEKALIKEKAFFLKSDGCSGPDEIFHICCLEHDIQYRTGKNFKNEVVTRRMADARFRQCMQEESKLKKFSPIAIFRWSMVRVFGRGGLTWKKTSKNVVDKSPK